MSSRNYIVLSEDLTPTKRETYRFGALAAGIVRSYAQGIADWNPEEIQAKGKKLAISDVVPFLMGGGWPANLDVREFQPTIDAGTAAAADFWNTAALAVIGNEYSVFGAIAVPAIGLRATKVVVWYKVQIETTPLPVSRLIFRKTAIAGSVMAQFDLEQLATGQKVDGYLSEPQLWDKNLPYVINVMARVIAPAAKVILGNFVFEPAGTVNI